MTEITKTKSQPLSISGANLQPVGLTFTRRISEAEWTQAGETLFTINGATMFWLGDWMVYGQNTWGEKYDSLIEQTGFDYFTLANARSVCKSVEFSRRREKLTFAHHAEVAKLGEQQQSNWLEVAEELNLTTKELRASIKAGKVVRAADALPSTKAGFDSIERLPLDFNRIYQSAFGEEDISECKNVERLRTWIESTQPMVEANKKARARLAELGGSR